MKKKGRPKKNKNLNINDAIHDINTSNLYPPNIIISTKMANKIINTKEIEHTVRVSCDKPSMFATLLDCIKGKDKYINIMFDKTGFSFTQTDNIHKDMIRYECKIFPDKLSAYDLSVDREVIKIELELLIKTLKSIPKDHIVTFLVYSGDNKRFFRILSNDRDKKIKSYVDTIININGTIGYSPITLKNKDTKYETIYKQESVDFHKNCVKINSFTNVFNIMCSELTKGEIVIDYSYEVGNLCSSIRNPQSFNFVFISTPSSMVKSTFNVGALLKLSKLHKISPVIKIYLSNSEPLIIEYTIGDGMGLMQIFCSQQNKI